ncbi:MAG: AAA family ATPase, partial [Candidatus Dormibacteria bacterium]
HAHGDGKPALGVAEKGGTVVFKCRVGCSQEQVVAALKERGLWAQPPQQRVPRTKTDRHGVPKLSPPIDYLIKNPDGELVAIHRRFDSPAGPKSFAWFRAGRGVPGLNGLAVAELPLYRSESLAELIPQAPVVIAEGEKAADALVACLDGAQVGVVATVGGAGVTPSDSALAALAGRRVVLWPDNDEPGQRHMDQVAAGLQRAGAAEVKFVSWPDAPEHGDGADYVAQHSRADLLRFLKGAAAKSSIGGTFEADGRRDSGVPSESGLPWGTFAELAMATPAEIDWQWQDYLARHTVNELDGKAKLGKTTFVGHLIRHTIDGTSFLGRPCQRTSVVFLTEEGPRTFRALLDRLGLADCPTGHVLSKRQVPTLPWPEMVAAAREKVLETGAGLLIVDTLSKLAGFRDEEENSAGKAAEALLPLQVLATELDLCILITRLDRKSGGDVGDSARGSSQLGGDVDVILRLSRVTEEGHPYQRRLQALGRFDELPEELVLELQGDQYVVLGDRATALAVQQDRKILDALPFGIADAISASKLAETLKTVGVRTAQTHLAALVLSGSAERAGRGSKSDPYLFYRNPSDIPADIPAAAKNGLRESADSISDIRAAGSLRESAGIAQTHSSPRIPAAGCYPSGVNTPVCANPSLGLPGEDGSSEAPATATETLPGSTVAQGITAAVVAGTSAASLDHPDAGEDAAAQREDHPTAQGHRRRDAGRSDLEWAEELTAHGSGSAGERP